MFATLALICFVLALFEVLGFHVSVVVLVVLGLVFLAAHVVLGGGLPWARRQ